MSASVYRMPSLGADMEAGTLIEWVKQPGEHIAKGDVIAVVETQKGAIEVEVFHDSVLGRLLVQPGETVPVGTPMAELEIEGGPEETLATGEAAALTQLAAPAPPAIEPGPAAETVSAPTDTRPAAVSRPRASPAARRLADRLGVALADLKGSGPDGAVLLADVEAAVRHATPVPSPPPPPRPTAARRGLDFAAMREAIAAAMARSKREIPHYYLSHAIDLTSASDWLNAQNAEQPPDRRILLGVLFIKAAAVTLHQFPELNGFDRDGRFDPGNGVHVGCAIAIRGGGLVAPAIHDADQLDLHTLMARLRDLVARARAGSLRASELADPTVTVSSLGERGADGLFGIIYPPQVAIIGFGTPSQRPWVLDDRVVVRTIVTATLAADHRHSDGHRGALFLAQVGQRLQEPETL
jgi:pyruvate dehydrogenase E2 component (dihydrolipoamide acetyltransferase)